LLDGFELQQLAAHHRRDRFNCRADSLNAFIRKNAKNQHKNRTTRVYVYASAEGVIAAFFTLSAHLLDVSGLPESLLKGRTHLPIPATLLGRFAVDRTYEGQGIGRLLLSYALREAYRSSQIVASAFVLLDVAQDASTQAVHLYRRCGFISLPSHPQRMILPMDEIGASVSAD